jgi:5-methyltetrahydropteroyltriglutamate--homocysteine methyltransferase
MRRSTDRILVSHAGTLPRPHDLADMLAAGEDAVEAFEQRLPSAVQEVVQAQAELGVDTVNDGEVSKRGGFSGYIRERLTGIEERPQDSDKLEPRDVTGRDKRDFPRAFAAGIGWFRRAQGPVGPLRANAPFFCTGPIRYVGHEQVQRDIRNLKAAAEGLDVELYLPAITPGTVEHWLWNEHYPDDVAFLFGIADALHEEYRAITDAGLILQLDDPDLPDGWQMYPEMSVAEYRSYADLRVEAINRALQGIPQEQVRLHICWGSGHGPHTNDIPLQDIADIALKVHADCYSVEAGNVRHEHEWRVWQDARLPEGKSLMPGVVSHATDVVEHPQVVADRLVRYANVVGRENVIAGTDCGLGNRVGHGEIAWAKLRMLVEGARLASRELWG